MSEETLNELEMQNAEMEQRVSLEEKKALIKKAKHRYGKDWMRILNVFKAKEGKGSGMDWQALKFRLE